MNLLKHIYLSRVHFSKLRRGYDPEDMAIFLMDSPIVAVVITISLWGIDNEVVNESVVIGLAVVSVIALGLVSRMYFYSSFTDKKLIEEFNNFSEGRKNELHTLSIMIGVASLFILVSALFILV